MNEARIADLLEPFIGTCEAPDLFRHISAYIDILHRWNARVNLTAIRDPDEIVTRHFGESLFAARQLFPADHVGTAPWAVLPRRRSRAMNRGPAAAEEDKARFSEELGGAATEGRIEPSAGRANSTSVSLADVGSGAGFPGLPIKLCVPELSVTLIESNHKKATFLREIIRALILTGINVSAKRAEGLPRSSFDVVTLRAVERFQAVLPAAAALVRPHGSLALFIGASQIGLAESILPGHTFSPPLPIPLSMSRVLLIGQALGRNQSGNQWDINRI